MPVPRRDVERTAAVVPTGYLLTKRTLALRYVDDENGCREEPHAHVEHAVFYPERATATLVADDREWPLSLGQGLWVPAGTVHSASRSLKTTLAVTFIDTRMASAPLDEVGYVTVGSALRELLQHLEVTGMPRAQRLRAQTVCLDLVTRETRPHIELPLPRDERIAPIAASLAHDPADDRSLEEWATLTAHSSRTVARVFKAETGWTFTQWRTRARLALAIRLLEDGIPVGMVARRVGYTSNSAFTAAFRGILQQPPRAYRAGHHR